MRPLSRPARASWHGSSLNFMPLPLSLIHISKLAPLSVDTETGLMLSPNETLQETHRHFSRAMAIEPLCMLSYENPQDRSVIDATVDHLVPVSYTHLDVYKRQYIRCSIYQPIAKITTAPQYNLSIFITRTCNQNKTTLIKNVFLYTLYASAYSLGVFP